MNEVGYFMLGACCTAFLAALFVQADDLSATKNGVRKDILSVEEYVSQQESCKKHGMQSVVAKNKDNQVVQVLCSTGTEVLKAK